MTDSVLIPDIAAALERGLRAKAARDPWGDSYLHCSDLGQALPEGCLRQVWLRLNGHPKNDDDLGKLWRFARGNQVHEALTPLLEEGLVGWEVVGAEIPLGEELEKLFGIERGSMDLLLWHPVLRYALVVDYKTMKTGGLLRLSSPKPENVLQVQGYMEGAELAFERACLGGVLVYVDREGQGGFKSYFVRRDRPGVEAAAEKLRELRTMEEPPPGPPPVGKKEHWRCEYRTRDGEISSCPFYKISCPGSIALAEQGKEPPPKAEVLDLMAALKASLEKKGAEA
jgi:hypothetical protein